MTRVLPIVLILALGVTAAGTTVASAAEPFAESCPKTALEEGSVTKLNQNPAAREAIVPAGATSLRLCRYYGFGAGNQTPKTQARAGELQDQRVVSGRDLLESVTLEFKELNPAPTGAVSCPFDEGAEMYAVFSYPHAKPVFIHIGLSGCRFVSGAVTRGRILSQSLQNRLLRLIEGKKPARPKHGEVKEKGAVERAPVHLTIPRARHSAKEVVEEACAGTCRSFAVTGCSRTTAHSIDCQVKATLASGVVCTGKVSQRTLGGEGVATSPGSGTGGPGCRFFLEPPEIRELMEKEGF